MVERDDIGREIEQDGFVTDPDDLTRPRPSVGSLDGGVRV